MKNLSRKVWVQVRTKVEHRVVNEVAGLIRTDIQGETPPKRESFLAHVWFTHIFNEHTLTDSQIFGRIISIIVGFVVPWLVWLAVDPDKAKVALGFFVFGSLVTWIFTWFVRAWMPGRRVRTR